MPLIDSTHFTGPHQLIVQLVILNTTVCTLCYYKQLVFRYSHIKNFGGFFVGAMILTGQLANRTSFNVEKDRPHAIIVAAMFEFHKGASNKCY